MQRVGREQERVTRCAPLPPAVNEEQPFARQTCEKITPPKSRPDDLERRGHPSDAGMENVSWTEKRADRSDRHPGTVVLVVGPDRPHPRIGRTDVGFDEGTRARADLSTSRHGHAVWAGKGSMLQNHDRREDSTQPDEHEAGAVVGPGMPRFRVRPGRDFEAGQRFRELAGNHSRRIAADSLPSRESPHGPGETDAYENDPDPGDRIHRTRR